MGRFFLVKSIFGKIYESVSFQWNTAHTDLVMCNYVWLEQLNVFAEYENLSDENIRFIRQNL